MAVWDIKVCSFFLLYHVCNIPETFMRINFVMDLNKHYFLTIAMKYILCTNNSLYIEQKFIFIYILFCSSGTHYSDLRSLLSVSG